MGTAPGAAVAQSAGVLLTLRAARKPTPLPPYRERSGSTSVSHGDLELHAHGLPPGSRALLLVGRGAAVGGQGVPFGDGLRCAQGAVRHLGTALVAADGYVDLGPALAAHPRRVPGDVRTFQVWYTDSFGACGAGYNLTSGLEVAFTF